MRVASRGLVTLVHYHQPILLCVLLVALCVTFFSWEGGENGVVPSTSRHGYEMTSYGDLGEVDAEPLDAPQSRRRRRRRIQPQAKGPKPGNRGGKVVEEVLEGEDGGEVAVLPPPPPPPPSRKQQRKQQLPSEQHEPVEVPAPLQPPQPCVESPPTTTSSSSSSPPPTLEEALAVLREAVASGALPGLRSTTVPTSSPTTPHEVRVDAALSAWAARQEAMLTGGVLPGDTSPPPPKFIAWKVTHRCEHMGLGNRLIGLISAMTLAFATGRGFIMAGDDAIVSAVLKPVGLDISQGSATRALERAGMGWSEEHLAWGLGMDSKCGCTDFLTATTPVFTMETTQYLVPCFTHNPYLRGVLAEALGPTTAAFRPMLKKFWALEPRLQDELERFARVLHPRPRPHPHPHPTTTTSSTSGSNNGGLVVGGVSGGAAIPPSQPYRRRHVVGLQIRKGHFVRMQHEEATFYRCAKQLGHLAEMGLPGSSSGGGEGGELGDALDTLDAALLHAKVRAGEEGSQGGSGAAAGTASALAEGGEVDVYYFLATDNGEVRSRARSILGEDRVITWSLSAEGKASGLGGESVAAVLDTWALSLCDDIILTYPKSTFGFVGSALSRSGAPPHAVISGSRHSASCIRLTSTEPVFHGWFMRWYASCYSRKEWETPEMLNQENAYHCLMAPDASADYSTWGTHRCPASDESDGLLYISSPFDYEAVSEVGESESFLGDAKVSRGELLGRFQGPYEQFLARAGQPIYG